MRHTFISWDSSFRNFHHLIDGLACQQYDLDQVELIYVEQRTREQSDAYNHAMGLFSLSDRAQSSHSFLKVLFMSESEDQTYHLGRILNVGLEQATGGIITIMDGDMLLPPDFLIELDKLHEQCPTVINVERKMCPRPLHANMDDWYNGTVDYEECLAICPDRDEIPAYVSNKGPMISATAEAFKQVGGYEEHGMFATGLSRAGQDLNARLEMATGAPSKVINRVAVHPYHPQGFSRKSLDAVRVLQVHADIIEWTRRHQILDWRNRREHLDFTYNRYADLFTRVHTKDYSRVRFAPLWKNAAMGLAYKGLRQLVAPFRP
jgi:hypothetical protein